MNPGIKPLQQERQSETYHRKQVLLKIEDKIILICFWSIQVKTLLILADGHWCIVNPWLICYQFPYCKILLLCIVIWSSLSFLFEFLCCVCECLMLGVKPCDPNAVLTPRIHTFTLHGCWHFTVAWTMWWADRVWGGLWVLFMEQLSILLRCCFNIFYH